MSSSGFASTRIRSDCLPTTLALRPRPAIDDGSGAHGAYRDDRTTAQANMRLMDPRAELLRHFLAALAYRTQKALRDGSPSFWQFRAAPGVRTPDELLRHMTSVLGYARTLMIGGTYEAPPLEDFSAEIARFHEMLEDLSSRLAAGAQFGEFSFEAVLQGPFSDAMTHAGQLAMLRRLHGEPVAAENFLKAEIRAENVGPDQAAPRSPGRRDGTWDPRGITKRE